MLYKASKRGGGGGGAGGKHLPQSRLPYLIFKLPHLFVNYLSPPAFFADLAMLLALY